MTNPANATQYAIVVNSATPGVAIPSNSSMIVVGPSADHNELRELLLHWFELGDRDGYPVPYHIREVAAPVDDLDRTAANAVIAEDNGNYLAGWTPDAGLAAHPFAMFTEAQPAGVERELIATMYKTRRAGFPRGAWVIEREPDGAELAAIGSKRAALARLREIVAGHFAQAVAA